MSDLARQVIQIVEQHGPLKATQIPAKLFWDFGIQAHAGLSDLIDQLVADRKLVEIEYVMPDQSRIKSILFPAEAEVRIR